MARLNIEDSLFKEPDFLKLIAKVGNYYEALGIVVSAFALAQKHWIEHKCIPAEKWHNDFEVLIECGLAERTPNGRSVVVRGSDKQFSWLEQKSKAGKSRSKNKLKTLKQNAELSERTPNGRSTGTERLPNLFTPSSLLLSQNSTTTEISKQKLTDRSSTAMFNARYENNEEWLAVLEEFGIKKKVDMFIGAIKATFETPEDLRLFIDETANAPGYKSIMAEDAPEKTKLFRIEKYTIAALKNTIGVKK